jgi:hypothetical protein
MTGRKHLKRLVRSTSGVAMIEFAIGAPMVLVAGLWGAETANYAMVNMRVSQLATQLADNASRIGDATTLQNRKIYEFDINDILYAAQVQSGSLDLYRNGRVIVSQVEREDNGLGVGKHYMKWQRCRGAKAKDSEYGSEGDRLPNGIGPSSAKVYAEPDDALIFVEVYYDYQPLVSPAFVSNRQISAIATFVVRDDRDRNQIYQRDPLNRDPVQTCSKYNGAMTIGSNGKLAP